MIAAGLAAGCGQSGQTTEVLYPTSPALSAQPVGDKAAEAAISAVLAQLYGPSPRQIKIPPGAPLPDGGRRLGSLVIDRFLNGDDPGPPDPLPAQATDPRTGRRVAIAGGYAIFRRNCQHCHGLSGDGNGPTATFLWPRPRNYQPGIFKFTSTAADKPARDDLRRTVMHGLAGTAMPAFEGQLSPLEIEQVMDHVMFLSMRGETQLRLAEEASFEPDRFHNPADVRELADAICATIFQQWTPRDDGGELQVISPTTPPAEPTRASILRGRALYLGQTPAKLQCAGCHGPQGHGDGPSFVDPEVFNKIVFRGQSITEFDAAAQRLWRESSLDAWGQPMRPANLNQGASTAYKGGQRPIDLYWRIARGINGAKMPAHLTALDSAQIWDLVNFVLALPREPGLLENASQAAAAADLGAPGGVSTRAGNSRR